MDAYPSERDARPFGRSSYWLQRSLRSPGARIMVPSGFPPREQLKRYTF